VVNKAGGFLPGPALATSERGFEVAVRFNLTSPGDPGRTSRNLGGRSILGPMPGKVIKVQRREKLGPLEQLYLPMILQGLFVTSRHFFRNLRGFVTGKNRSDFVVQYPEERIDYPDAFRGMPVLMQLDGGAPRCVACGLCEFACPTDCIHIIPGEIEGARIERYPETFEIDMARCMFCGLCEEACPEEAIVMSREVELADYDRKTLVFGKSRLLVPEKLLERRLAFIRGEYERADEAPRGKGVS
jgi:NADH-quinone oxidoreductase subunit I